MTVGRTSGAQRTLRNPIFGFFWSCRCDTALLTHALQKDRGVQNPAMVELVKRPNWDYFQTILSVISSDPGYLPESKDYQTLFPDGHVLARPKGDLDTPVNNVDRH